MARAFTDAADQRNPFHYLMALSVAWCSLELMAFHCPREYIIEILYHCDIGEEDPAVHTMPPDDWDDPTCAWIEPELHYVGSVCHRLTGMSLLDPPSRQTMQNVSQAMFWSIMAGARGVFGLGGNLFRGWLLHTFDRTGPAVERWQSSMKQSAN